MCFLRSMPKVLRIINRFNLGGPSYNAAYLSRFLDKGDDSDPESFQTMLIGGSPIKGEAHSGFIMDQLGVQYIEIPEMSRSINPFKDLHAFFIIRKTIRNFKPDIIHTHAAKAGALGRFAAYLEGVPVVVHTYHGHVFSQYFGSIKSNIVKSVERWLAKKTTAIVNISESLRSEIVDIHKICTREKTVVIPLGFDLIRFTVDQEKKRTEFRNKFYLSTTDIAIGIIGRFAPVKNHHLFFDTLARLKQQNISCVAFVIGDGNTRNELMDYARNLGVYENENSCVRVVFTSWIKQIDLALAGLDIVALTSLNEGTPVSIIEAQAAAKPVVSTDVGGVRDCIEADSSGYIVPMDADKLAQAISDLIRNPEVRFSFGNHGRQFVASKYTYTRLVDDMRTLYLRLLSTNHQKHK